MPDARPSYPRDYFSKPIPLEDTAFILMPFDGFDDVHSAIREGIKQARSLRSDLANLEAVRADDLRRTVVLEKILGQIGEAKVVIADLTGRNANVFYELGIAQTLKNNVILLAQNSQDVPADLQPFEYVPYTNSEAGLDQLAADLAETIRQQSTEVPASVQQNWGTAQHMKNRLRQLRVECEDRWVRETIPTCGQVLQGEFGNRLPTEEHEIKSLAIRLQPAFLHPWRGIEELGFSAIEHGSHDVLPDLLETLKRAHDLPTRSDAQPLITGHGQLLALRTWTLWGAYAIDHQDWRAVEDLLHFRVLFHTAQDLPANQEYDWGVETFSFAEYTRLPYTEATGKDAKLATELIYNDTESALQRFGDRETLRGLCGLWFFAAYVAQTARATQLADYHKIACVEVEYPLFPTWHASSRERFRDLVTRLENDSAYSAAFAKAVALQKPDEVNRTWPSRNALNSLREQLPESDCLDWLPTSFAEED